MKVKSLIAVFGLICIVTGSLMYLPAVKGETKFNGITCNEQTYFQYDVNQLLIEKLNSQSGSKFTEKNILISSVSESHEIADGKLCRVLVKVRGVKWGGDVLMDYLMLDTTSGIQIKFSRFNEI